MSQPLGVVWARESNRFDKTAYSIKSQLDACRQAAKRDGVAVHHELVERYSGVNLWEMPQLSKLRDLVAREPSRRKIVYVYAQDRLVRGESGMEILYLAVEFQRHNAEIRTVLNPVEFSSIAGQITALVNGNAAAQEVRKILDRTQRGKIQKLKEGKIVALGRRKYGYLVDKATGKARIAQSEAAVIRRVARWILREEESLLGAARRLNEEGTPTATGRARWQANTIRNILIDPAYKGDGYGRRRKMENGREVWRDKSEWIPLPGAYPAILKADEWDALQLKFAENSGIRARQQRHFLALRGLVFCSHCGSKMYVVCRAPLFYYRCGTYTRRHAGQSSESCMGRPVSANWLEDAVWEHVIARVLENPSAQVLWESTRTPAQQDGDVAELRAAVARKATQQANLLAALRDADASVAGLIKAELAAVEAERAALLARAAEFEQRETASQSLKSATASYVQQIRAYNVPLTSLPKTTRRKLILGLRLRVYASGREFALKVD